MGNCVPKQRRATGTAPCFAVVEQPGPPQRDSAAPGSPLPDAANVPHPIVVEDSLALPNILGSGIEPVVAAESMPEMGISTAASCTLFGDFPPRGSHGASPVPSSIAALAQPGLHQIDSPGPSAFPSEAGLGEPAPPDAASCPDEAVSLVRQATVAGLGPARLSRAEKSQELEAWLSTVAVISTSSASLIARSEDGELCGALRRRSKTAPGSISRVKKDVFRGGTSGRSGVHASSLVPGGAISPGSGEDVPYAVSADFRCGSAMVSGRTTENDYRQSDRTMRPMSNSSFFFAEAPGQAESVLS